LTKAKLNDDLSSLHFRDSDEFEMSKARVMGVGSYGAILRVRDELSGEFVVIKVACPERWDADRERNYERELQRISSIRHPGIVKILGFPLLRRG
jgi:serine/threonine protein kinase